MRWLVVVGIAVVIVLHVACLAWSAPRGSLAAFLWASDLPLWGSLGAIAVKWSRNQGVV